MSSCLHPKCIGLALGTTRFCQEHELTCSICATKDCTELAVRNTLYCGIHSPILWQCRFTDCENRTAGKWYCAEHESLEDIADVTTLHINSSKSNTDAWENTEEEAFRKKGNGFVNRPK